MSKLDDEIKSFQKIWKGGYRFKYSSTRNQKGVEDYLKNNMKGSVCLEIGCGGGKWSKYIYELNIFDKIYCIDVLSQEYNKFWEYVGDEKKDKIEYYHVQDFTLNDIPNNSLDYVFSYDVFCHISYSGQYEYIKNLYNKCKIDCVLMIMYSDASKYLQSEPQNKFHVKQYLPGGISKEYESDDELVKSAIDDCDGKCIVGRWYWIGLHNFLNLCNNNNYTVINEDLNIDKTNCITLFKK